MHCRICFGEDNLLPLKCKCTDDLSMIHYNCAKIWYSNHLDVVFRGKLKEYTWHVWATANCEICKDFINNEISAQIFKDYEKTYKKSS